jgi:hypothetical protein
LENFIKKFQKIGKWRRHVASCNFGENLVFFEKLENSKPPLSQAILTFWQRGGSSATGIHGNRGRKTEGGCMAVGIQPPCSSLQEVNQVTHQSQFKKPRKICWL